MQRFVIISIPRSGSTLLTRSLDEHPEIFCAGEIFNTSKDVHHAEWHFASWGFDSTSHGVQRINRIINYPNHRLRAIPHIQSFYGDNVKGETARGFKLMLSNIKSAPYMWDYIRRENIKVIVLIRKNIFKTVLSRYRKAINRVAHVTDGAAPDIHFSVPAQKAMEQMKDLQRANNKLISCSEGMNRLVMYYEDFFNWDETMNKVQQFLEVTVLALPPVLKKVGADKWQNEVENYKEVEALLQQNNFSEYI